MLHGIHRMRAILSRLGSSRFDYGRAITWLIALVISIPKFGLVTVLVIVLVAAAFELLITRPDFLVQVGWFVPILVFFGVALTVPPYCRGNLPHRYGNRPPGVRDSVALVLLQRSLLDVLD